MNVPSSVTMVNDAVIVFRDCARVDFSQGEDGTVAESPFGSWSISVISGVSLRSSKGM